MIKIGITGQAGFIGTHLYNFLSLKKDKFFLIPFKDEYFDDKNELKSFAAKCDYIVHLAALNRHNEPDVIYNKNIELVDKLINALEESDSKAHIIFSSSSQEEKDNVYGRSKREGREKLAAWAKKNGGGFTGLIIPNVFGPFGRPFYNSVISTFSHQLVNNETPKIETDAGLKLIYIDELVKTIENKIETGLGIFEGSHTVPHSYSINVTGILSKLYAFKEIYFQQGIIPYFESSFDINLFNTFRSYIPVEKHFPVKYKKNEDDRGTFVEIIKLYNSGQVSFSTTKPGITRGNHFHTRKVERFSVIKGEALIQLRKIGTSDIINLHISGGQPSFVDMPVWYTHNIKNIGKDDLYTIFWINEFYNPDDPDTYLEIV